MNKILINKLDIDNLPDALKGSLSCLELNYKLLDNLNVFPVPDGDTGVNMLLTMKPPVEAVLDSEFPAINKLLKKFNEEITNNSRGNSGFILSRFFNGFYETIKDADVIDTDLLKEAFSNGSYESKSSLMNPVEGTMITIISGMSEAMQEQGDFDSDIATLLEKAVERAEEILFNTPKMLPILAKAGVIDSGALGFIYIIKGMVQGINGEEILHDDEEKYRFEPDDTINIIKEDVFFRYCTEIIAEEVTNLSIDDFKNFLQKEGNSIALLHENNFLKLHIHTNNPEKIINEISRYGTVGKTKIDDMSDQFSTAADAAGDEENFSVLAIIPGEGFKDIFRDYGATDFILYNDLPSLKEILDTAEAIENDHIVLLPNDKNIIPVAMLAREKSEKTISIIKTSNIIQGISAMYGYSEFADAEENLNSMKENIDIAICLKGNICTKDTQYGDVRLKEGNFFITEGDMVLAQGETFDAAVLSALEQLDLSEKGNISFFYNDSIAPDIFSRLTKNLNSIYTEVEIDIHNGGQKKSPLIISVE